MHVDFDDSEDKAKLIVSVILLIIFLAVSYGLIVGGLAAGYQWWQIIIGLGLIWIAYVVIEYLMYNWDTYF